MSFLFVSTFFGYVAAAAGAGTLSRKLGFGNAMCLAMFVELCGVRIPYVSIPGIMHDNLCSYGRISSTARNKSISG